MNQVMVNEKTKTTTKLGMCKLMPKMNGDDLYINFCFNMDDHKEATIRFQECFIIHALPKNAE